MKTLLLLSALVVGSFSTQSANAQNAYETALRDGTIPKIQWMKELQQAALASPKGVVIIAYPKARAGNDKARKKFAKVAKQLKGSILITEIDLANTDEKSTLAKLYPQDLNQVAITFSIYAEPLNALPYDPSLSVDEYAQAIITVYSVNEKTATEDGKPADESKKPNGYDWSKIVEPQSDEELSAILAEASEKTPVIIDFSGKGWCGPCNRFHPVMENAAKAFQGKVRFVIVDMRRDGSAVPPMASYLIKGHGVPEVQIYKDGSKNGSVIQYSLDNNQFIETVKQATGKNP